MTGTFTEAATGPTTAAAIPSPNTLAIGPHSLGADGLIRERLPIGVGLGRGDLQRIAVSAEAAGRVRVQFLSSNADFPGAVAATVAGLPVHLVCEEDGSCPS